MIVSAARSHAPTILHVGYRNPGHFLLAYCTNLHRGQIFVRSPNPLSAGHEVRLELELPGERLAQRLAAHVAWSRSTPDESGPPGMGLIFDCIEHALAPIVDRMVGVTQPCRVDLVGASAFSTRQLGALMQSILECKVHHRELRHHVEKRCAGADLVVVDLEIDPQAGLDLILELSSNPHAPALLVICDEPERPQAQLAARHARVVTSPVDPGEVQCAVLQTLSQSTWLGAEAAALPRHDQAPAGAAQTAQGTISGPLTVGRLRPAIDVESSRPLDPPKPQRPEAQWKVDASWQRGPRPTTAPRVEPSTQEPEQLEQEHAPQEPQAPDQAQPLSVRAEGHAPEPGSSGSGIDLTLEQHIEISGNTLGNSTDSAEDLESTQLPSFEHQAAMWTEHHAGDHVGADMESPSANDVPDPADPATDPKVATENGT